MILIVKGHTLQETFDEIKTTYGEDCSSNDVKKWYHRLKCGRTSLETVPTPRGCQLAIDEDTVHHVESAILKDNCIMVTNFQLGRGESQMVIMTGERVDEAGFQSHSTMLLQHGQKTWSSLFNLAIASKVQEGQLATGDAITFM